MDGRTDGFWWKILLREIFFLRVTRGGERRRGLTRVIREWKVLVFVGLKVMEEVSKFVDLIEDYRKRK